MHVFLHISQDYLKLQNFFLLQRNKTFLLDINSNSEFKGPTKQMKAMKIESFGGKVCSCDKIEDIVRESERKSKSVGAGESEEEWPWLETKQVNRPSQGPYKRCYLDDCFIWPPGMMSFRGSKNISKSQSLHKLKEGPLGQVGEW